MCFVDFPKYPWPPFFPFVKEKGTPMMSCAQMGKCKSSNYKYSTQILDKFWLQHSHNKNSDASCLTFFQKCICFMNASALKVTSLPAILALLPEHWGKALFQEKKDERVN